MIIDEQKKGIVKNVFLIILLNYVMCRMVNSEN